MVCFVSAAAISALGSAHLAPRLIEILRVLSQVMMFVILEQLITDRVRTVRTVVTAYAAMAVPLLYTFVGIVLGSPVSQTKGSLTRTPSQDAGRPGGPSSDSAGSPQPKAVAGSRIERHDKRI